MQNTKQRLGKNNSLYLASIYFDSYEYGYIFKIAQLETE